MITSTHPDGDTPAEEPLSTLIGMWQSVLKDESIDASSQFEAHGGTSLKAVRIRARIRKRFNKDISLLEVVTLSTPRAVAGALASLPDWADDE
ncbi:acyl carrier protein [Streptomyces sp. NPDC059104]|uniref:acyl carrier protein n=1 Tax=Streptomyces sp. NPDC059104 TaxID=3346729 RepID=UPI00369595A1